MFSYTDSSKKKHKMASATEKDKWGKKATIVLETEKKQKRYVNQIGG